MRCFFVFAYLVAAATVGASSAVAQSAPPASDAPSEAPSSGSIGEPPPGPDAPQPSPPAAPSDEDERAVPGADANRPATPAPDAQPPDAQPGSTDAESDTAPEVTAPAAAPSPPPTPSVPSDPPSAPANESPSSARLSLLIALGSIDLPLDDLDVRIRGSGVNRTVTTDAAGRVALELPAGEYRVIVNSPFGRARQAVTLPPEGIDATVVVEGEVVEVEGRYRTAAEQKEESAEAVQVVDTGKAQRETVDLGEVLARAQGVGVRRSGGLGSSTRLSLNGLTDDQIRFFYDDIPLRFAGYPNGIANVPVNLVEQIEIYKGVVPVRFGADALGGAINLVSNTTLSENRAAASYQGGSFGTHRVTAAGRYLDAATGLVGAAEAFFDYSENDYRINVEVPDDVGRLSPASVSRFHDRYRAAGANLEVGVVGKKWADKLIVRGFITDFEADIQNNAVMTVPYGDARNGALTAGATARYTLSLPSRMELRAVAGYAYDRRFLLDVGTCVYSWFGECIRQRTVPGELGAGPRDQLQWQNSGFARFNYEWGVAEGHTLRASSSPTYDTRTGDERRQADPDARDPLTAERDLFTLVSGAEYELNILGDRFANIAFVKVYNQIARSEEPLAGGVFREQDRDTFRFGWGNSSRLRVADWLYVKASYEFATRLPRADEVFGNAVLIAPNLELEPEVSHNANLGGSLDLRGTRTGDWRAEVSGFLRDADNLIVLLGNDLMFTYQNVFGARSLGVEADASWTSPSQYLSLGGNVTYQSFRNTSSEGTFGDFEGDRIPNRPYLFANAFATAKYRDLFVDDELNLSWNTRYTHEFFRSWESVGRRDFKQTIDAQILSSLGLTYIWYRGDQALSATAEVDNITNARAFDFFGVQRPGRAFFFKTSATF